MPDGKLKSWIEGPKFARIPDFLRRTAWQLDLEIEIEREKHWLRETVYYTVRGNTENLIRFKDIVHASIQAHGEGE